MVQKYLYLSTDKWNIPPKDFRGRAAKAVGVRRIKEIAGGNGGGLSREYDWI